jgi:4-diphosphocytidyl-2-C-methyl-D-erythritol kinase
MQLTETARAKVNLTLRVLGRRAVGYHDLDSIVAFADVGDVVTLAPAAADQLTISGPFAADLAGHQNLVVAALSKARSALGITQTFAIALAKHLPIAAGLGGGSADAAAVLRLMRAHYPSVAVNWAAIALALGADVPVCLQNTAARMQGIGERVTPLVAFAPLAAVLVNPRAAVPTNKTAAIFKRLDAGSIASGTENEDQVLRGALVRGHNDLQAAAIAVMPVVADVLFALQAESGLAFARLSGAGPTCVGVFNDANAARAAAASITDQHAGWWVQGTTLR